MLKKVLLLATGGTIASVQQNNGLVPGIAPQDLLKEIPEVEAFCTVETVQLMNIDSTNIQPEQWLLIANCIEQNYKQYDGFIITHGTDTMAYTAAALSYLVQSSSKPIVLTGSQRPMGIVGSDAPKNLADSFRFCIGGQASGVYIVFDGKAIVGTRGRKVKTMSYSAFESINYPVAAYINSRHIVTYFGKQAATQSVKFYRTLCPRVFLLKLVPGMEPEILTYVAQNADAIIIEGYGMGGLPFADHRNFLKTVEQLSNEGKIIVLATQVMHEGSDLEVYEVGRRALEQVRLLQTFDMTLEAVVAKLMWILSLTQEFRQVREYFYTPIAEDIHLPRKIL